MDAELPKRFYKQGTEPQVDKINNSCKTSKLDFLSAKMPDEYNAVKRDPVFAPVFAIHENHLGFSATLVHSMMCRPSSQTMDAVMYLFGEKTSLRRWKPEGVGFMSYAFTMEIKLQHQRWKLDKKKFELTDLLMLYGKGELPSHGRTYKVWDVDIKRIYVPLNVNGNHWISLCINFGERRIEVFDCAGLKRYKEVDAFAVMIPRIVKEVQPPQKKKILNVAPYSVTYLRASCERPQQKCL